MLSSPPDLRSERLLLRQPIAEDTQRRLAIGSHKEVMEGYGGTFDPAATFTLKDAEASLRFIKEQPCAWVVDFDGFRGHIRLHSFAPQDKRASLAIGIEDPTCLGRGLGTEAVNLVLAFAFDRGLHRVSLRVLANNHRAIACYRKCGFVEEGREREAALIDGRWEDDFIMGKLNPAQSKTYVTELGD
jgi:RimJ/RimL family protein N-acetyltransferase